MWFSISAILLAGQPLPPAGEIVFQDAERQSRQFIQWYKTIKLNPKQEAVKKAALGTMRASCCRESSAYTCCCPCNLSRTIWGLSHYMIAREGATAQRVREKVREWIRFLNPSGFRGQACYNGRCERRFAEDGCGGMNADRLVF